MHTESDIDVTIRYLPVLELQLAVYTRGCARDDYLVLYWGGRVGTGKLSGSEVAGIAGHRYKAHYDTLLKDLRKHGQWSSS